MGARRVKGCWGLGVVWEYRSADSSEELGAVSRLEGAHPSATCDEILGVGAEG